MLSILEKIFGSKSVIDSGLKGIDSMVFTDQEKAKIHLDFLKMYEPFKLAQRVLSFMLVGTFLLVYLIAIVTWLIGVYVSNLETQGFYMETAFELAKWNMETLGTIVAIIVGFYFAGGVVSLKR